MADQNIVTSLTSDSVAQRKTAWLNCFPSNLSDLFYYTTNDGEGVQRVTSYYLDLLPDDHVSLKALKVDDVKTINLYMGCANGRFSPIFSIIKENKTVINLALRHDNPTHLSGIISEGVAELFIQKWIELSDREVGDAFSGATYEKWPNDLGKQNTARMYRVKSYTFESSDARPIVEHLKENIDAPSIRVFLGAGLTVRVIHSFNFRPIIFVPQSKTGKGVGTYYERAKPCPPFCND